MTWPPSTAFVLRMPGARTANAGKTRPLSGGSLPQGFLAVVVAFLLEDIFHAGADLLGTVFGRDLAEHHLRADFGNDLGDRGPGRKARTELRHALLPGGDHRLDELVLCLDVRLF